MVVVEACGWKGKEEGEGEGVCGEGEKVDGGREREERRQLTA